MVGLAVAIYIYELGISIYRCTSRTVNQIEPGDGNSDSSDENKRKSDIESDVTPFQGTDEKSALLSKSLKQKKRGDRKVKG